MNLAQIFYEAEESEYSFNNTRHVPWDRIGPLAQNARMVGIQAVLDQIATALRYEGMKANTYQKQDQWEAAAKLVEGMK